MGKETKMEIPTRRGASHLGLVLDQLAQIQRDLLTAAAAAVRPGGRLVYSVCTLTAEETSAIDAWAEVALPDPAALLDKQSKFASTKVYDRNGELLVELDHDDGAARQPPGCASPGQPPSGCSQSLPSRLAKPSLSTGLPRSDHCTV